MSNKRKETETKPTKLAAVVGMHVTVHLKDKSGTVDTLEFDLVQDKQSDMSSGRMSERAPLAQAILGHVAGEIIQFVAPSGEAQTITIVSVAPCQAFVESAPDRDNILDDALDKIARRESRQIALTAELHYGSIDPDGIKEG